MDKYSLGVALFDYIPVLLTGLAMWFLARGIAARHQALALLAAAAAVLIPAGGLCKASWKLLLAWSQTNLPWLENLLFIFLAPGFCVMSLCLRQARLAWQAKMTSGQAQPRFRGMIIGLVLILGGALALALLKADSRLWFFWLLAATTLGNTLLLIEAGRLAYWRGLGAAVISGLIVNFLATFALSGLSRLPAGEATAWIQQSVNLLAQGALLYSLWRISAAMRSE